MTKTDYAAERHAMVERQLRRRGIHDPRVLSAMGTVPRELFLPEAWRHYSYADEPAPIGHGQTISQPYMNALMAQCLELQGSETVLDVGAGSGYMAAVLGHLAARVVAVELIPELAAGAAGNLARVGAGNVRVLAADGSAGCPEEVPFDAISVDAGAPEVPATLVEQLADPGRLVVPVGSLEEQELIVVVKARGLLTERVAARCRFVPLLGVAGWP